MSDLSVFDKYDELFVHYGHDQFDSALFQPIENISFMKPKGGFWSAPVNTDNGWKEFLREEFWDDPRMLERLNHKFQFRVKKDARILNIASLEDLNDKPLPTRALKGNYQVLDFEKLAQDYDAMFLDLSHDTRLDYLHDSRVRGFDVDTLLVFNPDIIRQSADIDVTAPLSPTPSLDEIYQQKIDARLYSYKDTIVSMYEQQGMFTQASQVKALEMPEFVTEIRKDFDAMWQAMIPESQKQLMAELGESTAYAGLHYGEIVTGRPEAFIDMVQNLPFEQDALIMRKNNSLVLFAHGSPDGGILFHGKEYQPATFFQELYDAKLIPDDIVSIYTMNCYGGKQSSTIAPGGIKVSSAHTSTTPILGSAMIDPQAPMFGVVLNTGDMTDEFKQFSLEDGQLEVLYSTEEINQALQVRPRKKQTWGSTEVTSYETVSEIKEENVPQEIISKTIQDVEPEPEAQPVETTTEPSWEMPEAYSDEFYQSRGLDPIQQRQEIKELYEAKGAELPEGLKKYFPDTAEPEVKPEPVLETKPVEPTVEPQVTPEKVDPPIKEARVKVDADEVVDAVADTAEASKKLPTKKLGTGGKIAIGIAIAGLVTHALVNNNDKEEQDERVAANAKWNSNANTSFAGKYSNTQVNSYDAQIAANISGYGYGKRVGGFM